jgi:ferrous iron transport protein B
MESHAEKSIDLQEKADGKVILVGAPNVGKSVIFGHLTGRYVTVSNYPGTTVEISKGLYKAGGSVMELIDTPGINSLLPMSEDEKVTRDIIIRENASTVLQVCDSKNLERSLSVTIQLIEFGVDMGLILNMMDEAEKHGLSIDSEMVSHILGIPVVKTVAVRKKGFEKISSTIINATAGKFEIHYGDIIEESIRKVTEILKNNGFIRALRGLSIAVICGDQSLTDWLHNHFKEEDISRLDGIRHELEKKVGVPVAYHINNVRHQRIQKIISEFKQITGTKQSGVMNSLGNASMHPVYGIPILMVALYLAYVFVGQFGAGTLVDFLEGNVFEGYVNPFFIKLFDYVVPWQIVKDFFVGEYGVITMALTYSLAIIFPIVGTFFIGFGIMEDSGYLPRLAVMVDRLFKKIGCNGKAVLPLILGLGCDTMATLTTRILETKKERLIITLLLALGIPCSAQLGVVLGMLGSLGLFATAVWTLFIIGIIITVGFLAAKLMGGEEVDFIMEIPPLRIPQFRNILIKTMARIEWYLKEAVPLFVLGTVILFVIDKFGILSIIEKISSPIIVGLLDLPPKTAESFIIGFLSRDYGASGLFSMQKAGLLDTTQVMVSLITITLFIPCIANFFVIIKEQGKRIATYMFLFIFPFAIFVGFLFNKVVRLLNIHF